MARRARIAAAAGLIGALLVIASPAESSRRSSPSHDWAFALAIQKDGKLVAAGLTYCCNERGLALARYTANGRLDRSFGRGGKVVINGHGYAATVAIQPDGRVVAGGGTDQSAGGLVRLTRRGTPDATFGRGGRASAHSSVYAVVLQRDEKIVAGGDLLARYTRRGTLDSRFGRNGRQSIAVRAIALQPDGKIVTALGNLDRFNVDGSVDSSFGKGGITISISVSSVAIDRSGKIVAAGDFGSSSLGIARFSTDGTLDASFGRDGMVVRHACGSVYGEGVAIQRDGKIVAIVNGAGCSNFMLFRYNTDGSFDTSFGRGGKVVTGFVRRRGTASSSSWAEAVVIQPDGKIVVAGLGNGYDFALARYTTGGQLDRSFGSGGKVLTDFSSG
jgi:uncharacterized delta-60 repeat protein